MSRYLDLIRTSHVWLLAPTWIAVNAAIGVWLSQSVFQLAKGNPKFPEQLLMGGFTANQITIGALVIAAVFGAGLIYWGNRFKTYRRTTIIGYGVLGGAVLVVAGIVVNHLALEPAARRPGRRRWPPPVACSCWPARRRPPSGCSPTCPSASRPTAARSWASTRSSSRSARSSAA